MSRMLLGLLSAAGVEICASCCVSTEATAPQIFSVSLDARNIIECVATESCKYEGQPALLDASSRGAT